MISVHVFVEYPVTPTSGSYSVPSGSEEEALKAAALNKGVKFTPGHGPSGLAGFWDGVPHNSRFFILLSPGESDIPLADLEVGPLSKGQYVGWFTEIAKC